MNGDRNLCYFLAHDNDPHWFLAATARDLKVHDPERIPRSSGLLVANNYRSFMDAMVFQQKIHFITPKQPQLDKPLLVFLPGMDGTGLLLGYQISQFNLAETFDIRCLAIPKDDLSSWSQLTQSVIRLLRQEIGRKRRPVYLCGESFGGCLAMQVALEAPNLVDRIILVNPASCFNQQAWLKWGSYLPGWLPTPIYHVGVMGLLPLLGSLSRMPARESRNLLAAMQSVSHPSSTWRLNLLREFEIKHQQLAQISQPVLVIASTDDWLLPSVRESQRLMTFLPNARRVLLQHSGHACLLETNVNLIQILQAQNFLSFLPNLPNSPPKVSAA